MNRRGLMIATLTALWCVPLIGARDDGSRVPRRESPNAYGYEVIATGRVQHVHAPRLFTVERRETPDQPLLVFVPYADATPIEGTVVTTGGRLRRFEDAQVEETDDWSQLDAAARESFVSGPVLVATSLVTSTGRQLARRAPRSQAAAGLLSQEPRRQGERRDEWPIPVLPGMVGDNVVTLAGHAVRVANARVVGVFNSHAFLIETQASLRPLLGNRSRVVVFIDKRALNVAPETLVAESVTVSGIVRTLLGMHVSREVAWPPALTREAVERLEIRAALLATAVQTPEGIDLTAAGE